MRVTVIVEPGRVQLDATGTALSGIEPDEDTAEIGRELVAAVRSIAQRAVRMRGRRELVRVDGWTAHAPVIDDHAPSDPGDPPCSSSTPSPAPPLSSAGAGPETGGSPPPGPAPSTTGPAPCGGPTTPADDCSETYTGRTNGHSLPADPQDPPDPPEVVDEQHHHAHDELATAFGQSTQPDRGIVHLEPPPPPPSPSRLQTRPRIPPEKATDAYVRSWCVRNGVHVSLTGDLDPAALDAYTQAYEQQGPTR